MTTTLDEIRTADGPRLSEIAAKIMGWKKGYLSGDSDCILEVWLGSEQYRSAMPFPVATWNPSRDRNHLWLVLEKVPEEKRELVQQEVYDEIVPDINILFVPPDVVLRAALEVLLG